MRIASAGCSLRPRDSSAAQSADGSQSCLAPNPAALPRTEATRVLADPHLLPVPFHLPSTEDNTEGPSNDEQHEAAGPEETFDNVLHPSSLATFFQSLTGNKIVWRGEEGEREQTGDSGGRSWGSGGERALAACRRRVLMSEQPPGFFSRLQGRQWCRTAGGCSAVSLPVRSLGS